MMTSIPHLCDPLSRGSERTEGVWKRVFSIPAKAMLFGEYGVLKGGPALVLTWPSFCLQLEARQPMGEAAGVSGCVRFSSSLLGSDLVVDAEGRPVAKVPTSPQSPAAFVSRALAALIDMFGPPPAGLELRVQSAYPPRLGFGSSSALVVALYLAFLESNHPGSVDQPISSQTSDAALSVSESDVLKAWPQHWLRLFRVLRAAQGKGSGYDVAVQFWAALCWPVASGPKLWLFRPNLRPVGSKGQIFDSSPQKCSSATPEVKQLHCPLFWRGCGFFVESLVTAPTAHVLAELNEVDLEPHFRLHSERAEEAVKIFENTDVWSEWVQSGGSLPHPLSGVVSACLEVAREQGIAGHIEPLQLTTAWARVVEEWQGREPVFKTMGAGRGDSVWVLSARPAQKHTGAIGETVSFSGPSVIFQHGALF